VSHIKLGYLLANAAIKVKEYERTVTAKGLSEREYPADIIIWPIQFTEASNELIKLYSSVDASSLKIKHFLQKKGISEKEISFSSPVITDKSAQQYGNAKAEFRYTATEYKDINFAIFLHFSTSEYCSHFN
jgi:hypothetical protein